MIKVIMMAVFLMSNVAMLTVDGLSHVLSNFIDNAALLVMGNKVNLTTQSRYQAKVASLKNELNLVKNKNIRLTQAKIKNKKTVHKMANKIRSRTLRNISVNVSSIPAGSVPLIGAGVVIGVTAMDINDACNSMKDMDSIFSILEIEDNTEDTQKVCGYNVNEYQDKYDKVHSDVDLFLTEFKNKVELELNEIIKLYEKPQ